MITPSSRLKVGTQYRPMEVDKDVTEFDRLRGVPILAMKSRILPKEKMKCIINIRLWCVLTAEILAPI